MSTVEGEIALILPGRQENEIYEIGPLVVFLRWQEMIYGLILAHRRQQFGGRARARVSQYLTDFAAPCLIVDIGASAQGKSQIARCVNPLSDVPKIDLRCLLGFQPPEKMPGGCQRRFGMSERVGKLSRDRREKQHAAKVETSPLHFKGVMSFF